MDLLKLGAQLLSQRMGSDVSEQNAENALGNLLGGGAGGVDISALVSKLINSDSFRDIVSSWLGDGGNKSISAAQIFEIFDAQKLASFAGQLNVDQQKAAEGLSDVLPQMIDKSSSNGNLLDAVGGLGGALDMAKKLF